MAFYIKVLLDEVFGARYFRNWITRKKCNPKNYTRRAYGNVADYIMFYTKSDQYVWNRPVEPWTPERAAKEYIYVEEKTGRRYKKVPLHAPGTRAGATGQPWRGMLPPPGKHWQFPPTTLEEMDQRGEIYWSATGNPRRKIYLDESAGIPIQDIWLEFRDAHNQNIHVTGYPTEKNPDLLARIIQASSNPGDLVLDCFAGSGTTLAVASQLDRRWIGIDCSPEAIATTLRRFAKGPEPMGDFVVRSETEPLPLFNLAEPSASYPVYPMIRDFTLYATPPYQGELDDVLTDWQNWIKERP
jgi:adenine-specific DNA-methyltransferase